MDARERSHTALFAIRALPSKKSLKISKNLDELEQMMQRFIEESKQMDWHLQTGGVYHKDEGEKLADKVFSEFERYATALRSNAEQASPADLLSTLDLMEQYIKSFKVT